MTNLVLRGDVVVEVRRGFHGLVLRVLEDDVRAERLVGIGVAGRLRHVRRSVRRRGPGGRRAPARARAGGPRPPDEQGPAADRTTALRRSLRALVRDDTHVLPQPVGEVLGGDVLVALVGHGDGG